MKKFLALLLAVVMILAVVGCAKTPEKKPDPKPDTPDTPVNPDPATPTYVRPASYERADEAEIYDAVLGEYETMINAAKAASSIDERFVLFAKAEAYLLDSAVMVPTTTQGGAYTISRIAPHTVPYVQWGNDDDRLKSMVIADKFITKTDRAALLDQWAKACAGEGTYDPAAYLTSKGYGLVNVNKTATSSFPITIDWLSTSKARDTEVTVNTVDGLVEYDNLNQMQPALATSWTISEDGLTYTFNIRKGVYWYTADGTAYAELTAKDFEAGFQHMLDGNGGLQWLVDGVISGVHAYLKEGGEWSGVGYKATGDYELTITLEAPTSYFMTMLTYSCFLPICDSFYQSKGGVYGIQEFKAASADTANYTYGVKTDIASQVYCGAYRITKFGETEIILTKNTGYYNADKVTLDNLYWVYDDGSQPLQTFADVINGVYPGTALSESTGTLKKAQTDKLGDDTQTIFDKYAYVSDTNSTTFFAGLNLARGTYVLESGEAASPKTEAQKIDTNLALQNKNFRQALLYAFDRATWNAVTRGADLATTNLRNMYTHPQFVSLANDVTVDGKEWKAGTFYGEMVQYYLEQMGSHIIVDDQLDGWFNPSAAREALVKAVEELKAMDPEISFPITIDIVYYGASTAQTAQARAFQKGLETALGASFVKVNLVNCTTTDGYYKAGYDAPDGESADYDLFYGSGWGPDYGDPSTYLDTFLGYGEGYMTKVIGLF